MAGLDHPGIVAIHDLARREDGTLFCAQKLIRGENLQARIAKCRSLADRLGLVRHVLDACEAMGFAHSRHVIHRDLKPSNVMVGEFGEVYVMDWGLARSAGSADAHDLRLRMARYLVEHGDKAAARSELDVLSRLGTSYPRQSEVHELLVRLQGGAGQDGPPVSKKLT